MGAVPVGGPSFSAPFPVSRVWTSRDSPHTCSLGSALFSCSPSHSSGSCSGRKSCTTRNPVRLLVSRSALPCRSRGCLRNVIYLFIFSERSFQRKAGGSSCVPHQGSVSRWGAVHLVGPHLPPGPQCALRGFKSRRSASLVFLKN